MSTVDRNEAVQIAKMCVECGQAHLTPGFLSAGLSLDEVKTRVSAIGAVHAMMATAGRCAPHLNFDFAATMLTDGAGIPAIRSAIFDVMATAQEKTEISSHIPADTVGGAGVAASSASMQRTLKTMGLTPVAGAGA